jgi:hypothetical protein
LSYGRRWKILLDLETKTVWLRLDRDWPLPTRIYRGGGVVASVGRWACLARSLAEVGSPCCCVVYCGHRRMRRVWRCDNAVLDVVVKRHGICS